MKVSSTKDRREQIDPPQSDSVMNSISVMDVTTVARYLVLQKTAAPANRMINPDMQQLCP